MGKVIMTVSGFKRLERLVNSMEYKDDTVYLQLKKGGVAVRQYNVIGASMIDLFISKNNPDYFEVYEVAEEWIGGIRQDELSKVARVISGELIEIETEKEFRMRTKRQEIVLKFADQSYYEAPPNIDKAFQLPLKMKMEVSPISEALKSIKTFSKTMHAVRIVFDGDSALLIYSDESPVRTVLSKDKEIFDCFVEDKKPRFASYNIDALRKIIDSVLAVSDVALVRMDTDQLIMFEVQVPFVGNLFYLLAPYIEKGE